MYHLCTLFDSAYLDKGLALHQSLMQTGDDFRLYIFAFDELAYQILTDIGLAKTEIISLRDFETEDLLKVKEKRTRAEYCWTCTPWIVRYVLDNYFVEACTYIDADLYFFRSPKFLLDEIMSTDDSVIITEHRFAQQNYEAEVKAHGKYCVQFNTFKNNDDGNLVLDWWKDRCLEWCHFTKSGDLLGDQKYLDHWMTTFQGVHELQNLGGGVAPWNLRQYRLDDSVTDEIVLVQKETNIKFTLIFYHFQNIRYISHQLVNIRSGSNDKVLKMRIYIPYLVIIEQIRAILKNKYNLQFTTNKSYSSNPFIAFIQNHIMQYNVKSISDIINLKRLKKLDKNN